MALLRRFGRQLRVVRAAHEHTNDCHALPAPRTGNPAGGPRALPVRRLRTRLLVSIAGLAILISLASGLSTTYVASHRLRQQLERQGEIMVSQLARDTLKDQQEADPDTRRIRMQVLTYRLAADAGYAQVVIGGKTISEFISAELSTLPDPPLPIRGMEVRDLGLPTAGRPSRFIDFVQALPPAAPDGSTGGNAPSYVRVGVPLLPVDLFVGRLATVMASLTLLFAAGGGLLALGLYRGVLGPLDRLVRVVERVRQGDLSARAMVHSGDELQLVADEFNRMVEALDARERRLQQMNRDLAAANAAKSQFLAIMGHEWKTPLHSIRGYCQLLLEQIDGPLNPEQVQDVETVLRAATHLIDLVDNLLHFNAAADDTAVARPEPVDLTALTEEAWNHLRPLAREKALRFDVRLPSSLEVMGHSLQIRQVFINLLGNAVKYTPSGRITVRGGVRDGWVWWQVEDTGIGIDPALTPVIFEPFQRGDGHRPGVEGLGLGLTVVRRFVEAHGGRIEVKSIPRKGSRFTVYLPQPAAAPEAAVLTPQPDVAVEVVARDPHPAG